MPDGNRHSTNAAWRMAVETSLGRLGVGFVCVAVIIGALWYFTSGTVYYLKTDLDRNVVALWNAEEIFIFAGKRIEGVTGSPMGLLLKSLRSTVAYQHEHERGDLIVEHISVDSTDKHVFENFGLEGVPYPVHGNIYYERLTNQTGWPALWRWSGTNFDRVDANDARTMLKSLPSMSDLMAKEGWSAERIVFTGDSKAVVVGTRGERSMAITLQLERHNDLITVAIVNRLGDSAVEILAQGSSEYRRVSKAHYCETFEIRGPNADAQQVKEQKR